eukprot:7700414-Ditylum_brightwellii.AAC.2
MTASIGWSEGGLWAVMESSSHPGSSDKRPSYKCIDTGSNSPGTQGRYLPSQSRLLSGITMEQAEKNWPEHLKYPQ